MEMQTKRELYELLDALVDGSPDDHQQRRLGELLSEQEARQVYLEYVDLHAELMLSAQRRAAVTPDLADLVAVKKNVKTVRPTGGAFHNRALAVAALAVALMVAFLLFWRQSPQAGGLDPQPLASVVEMEEAEWSPDSSAFAGSKKLTAGMLNLRRGTARLEMGCGARVSLRAPATLELIDSKAVRLLGGAMTVIAPDSAVGFRVLTPTADVVDLGTEFSVAVDAAGATEVHVSRGVVVTRSTGSEAVVPILQGEAGRIDVEQGDIVPTRFDATRFARPSSGTPDAEAQPQHARYAPIPADARVVFLGDRATDRETHLLLINQAFAELPSETQPKLFNRGVCFRLLSGEREFERHVASFRPTHAVLQFSSELAMNTGRHLLSEDEFERAISRLCRRLENEDIEPIIATGFPLDERFAAAQPVLDKYNAYLRRLADERGYRLADVEQQFQLAGKSNVRLLAGNGRWPTFEGHRQIARAILTAWGYPDAEVANTLELSLLPGVVTQWRYRFKRSAQPLEAEEVARLRAVASWQSLSLPQSGDKFARRLADRSHSITYRDRMRGFATNLFRKGSEGIEAIAAVESDQDRTAFLNTGATLQTVWLNGEKVFEGRRWTGWHAGKQRIPVQLRAGENKIVIEADTSFFVSITDEHDWPLP